MPAATPSSSRTEAVPLSDITLWQMGTIPSVHVFPGPLRLERFQRALLDVVAIYPVVAGRFKRRTTAGSFDYYIDLTSSPIPLTFSTSDSLAPPFSTSSVIQPALNPFINPLDVSTQLNNPDAPLLSVKVTTFRDNATTVIGLCWAHLLGDGHAFSTFTRILSRLYEGVEIPAEDYPSFKPHVDLIAKPARALLAKWEHPILFPTFELTTGRGMYAKAAEESEVVQVVFTLEEMKLLKHIASGTREEDWVSEQDALSSYWINLLRLAGVSIESVVNSVNYRFFFPTHPSFPPNLPSLCANVAQMLAQPLPPTSSSFSLRPVARAIRQGLQDLRSNPETAREWLSCRAYRMRQTCDAGETQCMVPVEGDCIVNSNWRYDWNASFGFAPSETQHHTSFSTRNFLRVFRTNPNASEQGAECTWQMSKGLAAKALSEIAKDREEQWSRWK